MSRWRRVHVRAAGACRCGRTCKAGVIRCCICRAGHGNRSSSLILGVRQVGGMHQFQFIQRQVDHAVLRIVPDRTWQPDLAERMRQVIQAEFEAPVRVDVELKDSLERPPGGKLKIAIIELE